MADVQGSFTDGPVWAVVLSAGSGRRFGGPKQLADLAGKPMALWALDAAMSCGLDRVLLVAGPEGRELMARAGKDQRLKLIINPDPQRGMGSSLALAAACALEHGARALAVLLADMPLVEPNVIAKTVQACLDAPQVAAAAFCGNRRIHPVAFGARHLPELAGLSGDEGGRHILARLGDDLARVEAEPKSALDVDRPEDLDKARRILMSRQALCRSA